MAVSQKGIKKVFESSSESFDKIYSEDSGVVMKHINRLFRWDIKERARVGFEILCVEDIHSVLDIGCGTGRLSLRLARCGKKVTGIDFSSSMIEKARIFSKAEGQSSVEFLCADFLKYDFKKTFGACIAFGFFDYTADAGVFFDKIGRITNKMFIATFPIKYSLRSIFRKIRLFLLRRQVYFYSPGRIEGLFARCGFEILDFRVIGNLYFVTARKRPA